VSFSRLIYLIEKPRKVLVSDLGKGFTDWFAD
jgi:hypothetical protein